MAAGPASLKKAAVRRLMRWSNRAVARPIDAFPDESEKRLPAAVCIGSLHVPGFEDIDYGPQAWRSNGRQGHCARELQTSRHANCSLLPFNCPGKSARMSHMEVRFTYTQAFFGGMFGIFGAQQFGMPWWGYALAAPIFGALAFYLSLWRLRALDLKPNTLFVDYMRS